MIHPEQILPTTRDELISIGLDKDQLDVILISGDAYVDHPSFGVAMIGRYLESLGYSVGIIPQPDIKDSDSFRVLGTPRLFVGITSGNMDSMISNYTAARKPRRDDFYSENGAPFKRPDRALLVYSSIAKQVFKKVPVVLGGIEASLRRLSHYDFWQEKVRRSTLLDAKADYLVYGMGETAIGEIARLLAAGERDKIRDVRGVCYLSHTISDSLSQSVTVLPSFEEVSIDRVAYASFAKTIFSYEHPESAGILVQKHGDRYVVVNPPALPLETEALDRLYELPFTNKPHPRYCGSIPAYEMIKDSVTIMRGCFGGCSFCALTEHQGKIIQSRSLPSVLGEVKRKVASGTKVISDLGGPTANMYRMHCSDEAIERACRKPSCVDPKVCIHLKHDHAPLIQLYEEVRKIPGLKKAFVASGVRYDLALDSGPYIAELATHHTGGHLKVAPEESNEKILKLMRKPSFDLFVEFKNSFEEASAKAKLEQYLVPYLIVGFPGATIDSTIELALKLKKLNFHVRQIQDFIPAPMTLSSAYYYLGSDPMTGEKLHIAKEKERRLMKTILQFYKPENFPVLARLFTEMGRKDLIGPKGLIGY